MAKFSDLTFRYRLFMKTYRYRSFDWSPGTSFETPLNRAKIALLTTAAFYLPDQEPFDESEKGGDFSYRIISSDADIQTFRIGHRSSAFEADGIMADPNLAFPLDRLKELQQEGVIGAVNHRHFSFMGSVTAPGRLLSRSAPEAAEKLKEDQVDAVLLTPV